MTPGTRPLLIFDGDCSFCRGWIARWLHRVGDRLDVAPFQEVADRFPAIPRERFARGVQLVMPDGTHCEAAEAVYRSLALAPGGGAPLWLYRHLPLFAPTSEWCYRVVADHRPTFERLTRLLWGGHLVPPGERVTQWLFVRLLGVIFAIAFLSLAVQITGLIGTSGILPVHTYLDSVRAQLGPAATWFAPTLCWLWNGDLALRAMAWGGLACSLLLAAGVLPAVTLALALIGYLSLTSAGQDFMWFQWDGLLLETGVLALFLVPWRWWSRPYSDPPPSRAGRLLTRWLLFRLMFSSGAAKWLSGDPTWRAFTALDYHYQTQPLPPWTAWYAHHLPHALQRVSVGFMFATELLAPLLLFAPRRPRLIGAGAIALIQVLMMASGNYGFFNLLTLALCLSALDDAVWPMRRFARRAPSAPAPAAAPSASPGRSRLALAAAIAMLVLSLVPFAGTLHLGAAIPAPLVGLDRAVGPLRIVNSYGLFAVMTTERHEIEIQGSADGGTWRTYDFRYKPGDVSHRPRFVVGHMPRLDWQMWFAALDDFRREHWFLAFCHRLLEGAPAARSLLAGDPFPGAPPRYLRAIVYDYRFTTAAERARSGAWWSRQPLGLYCPVLTLEDGRMVGLAPPGSARGENQP
jgi:predicted DCC family thiol-disulfide oxidoreductase YuxK